MLGELLFVRTRVGCWIARGHALEIVAARICREVSDVSGRTFLCGTWIWTCQWLMDGDLRWSTDCRFMEEPRSLWTPRWFVLYMMTSAPNKV